MALTREQRMERIVNAYRLQSTDALGVSDRLFAEGNFEQSIRALGMCARALGTHAAVFLRHPSLASERRESRQLIVSVASRMASSFDAWQRRGPTDSNPVHAGEFGALMVALLAVDEVGAAESIAAMVGSRVVRDNTAAAGPASADMDDVAARLLAATIVRDRLEFDRQMKRWPDVTADLFLYRDYWPYPRLMQAIVLDDAQGFTAGLEEADRLFVAKSSDRRMRKELSTDHDPDLAVDLQSLALANLARARGLEVTYASETVPAPSRERRSAKRPSVLSWISDLLRDRTAAIHRRKPSDVVLAASPESRSSPGGRATDQLRFAMDDIESVRQANPANMSQGKFNLVTLNAADAVNRYLERIAILMRSGAEPASVDAEVAGAETYIDQMMEAVRRCGELEPGPSKFVHQMTLMWPMVLLMLAGRWDRLDAVARMARLPYVHEEGLEAESGGVDDTITKMLVALVLDEPHEFARARTRFSEARTVDRYYERYFEYDRLMDSVLRRDTQDAQRAAQDLEALYLRRATDDRLVQLPLLAASGADNDLVVDIWAVALLRFARHRGLGVDASKCSGPDSPG